MTKKGSAENAVFFCNWVASPYLMSYKRLMASIHSSLASEQRERSPIREILDRALAGARLSDADAIALIECPDD